MAKALLILKLLLSIGPDILKFIQKLEDLFPEGGKGDQKLEMLKAYVESIWQGLGDVIPAFEEVWPKIQGSVAALVSVFNKFGIFKK